MNRLSTQNIREPKKLTQLADMSLEAFLPGVRKGGLSNTIWGSLYFDLSHYNWVGESSRNGRSEISIKSSDNLLDLNLKYFGLPFCNGGLSTNARNVRIAQIKNRNSDLLNLILLSLEGCKWQKGL